METSVHINVITAYCDSFPYKPLSKEQYSGSCPLSITRGLDLCKTLHLACSAFASKTFSLEIILKFFAALPPLAPDPMSYKILGEL